MQALPAGAAASTAVDNTDMEAAMRALLGSIHHFSDGRVRLRHPLFRESSTFGALHTLLCEGTGIRDATFNAVTGSALLTYDPGQTSRKEFLQQALPLGARRGFSPAWGPACWNGRPGTPDLARACPVPADRPALRPDDAAWRQGDNV